MFQQKIKKERSFSEDYISDSESVESINNNNKNKNKNNNNNDSDIITFTCYNKKMKSNEKHIHSKNEFEEHARNFTSHYHISCPTCGRDVENEYIRNGEWIVTFSKECKNIMEKCTYVNGKFDGLYEHFFLNGTHYEKSYYKNGVLDGPCTFWYDTTGKRIKHMTYVNGKLEGSYKYWSQDGILKEDFIFKNG
jgi:antitoxin component YwqK of YwqJK toxin-antitoxin module